MAIDGKKVSGTPRHEVERVLNTGSEGATVVLTLRKKGGDVLSTKVARSTPREGHPAQMPPLAAFKRDISPLQHQHHHNTTSNFSNFSNGSAPEHSSNPRHVKFEGDNDVRIPGLHHPSAGQLADFADGPSLAWSQQQTEMASNFREEGHEGGDGQVQVSLQDMELLMERSGAQDAANRQLKEILVSKSSEVAVLRAELAKARRALERPNLTSSQSAISDSGWGTSTSRSAPVRVWEKIKVGRQFRHWCLRILTRTWSPHSKS